MSDDAGHLLRNRALWDDWSARYVADGERAWASSAPSWGIWSVPERDVGMLPADLAGSDAIELGCGTGYVSSWLARRGARVTGIDNSSRLKTIFFQPGVRNDERTREQVPRNHSQPPADSVICFIVSIPVSDPSSQTQ